MLLYIIIYLISLISTKVWRLKEGGTYFEVWEIIYMKCRTFIVFLFQITINVNHYYIQPYIFQSC